MKKASEILDLPVFCIQDGLGLEKVARLAVDAHTRSVAYLAFAGTPWYEPPWVLPWSMVKAVGRDLIAVKSREDMARVGEDLRLELAKTVEVVGAEVIDSSGRLCGSVEDFELDEATGELRRLLLKGGGALDIASVLTLGMKAVFVESGVKEEPRPTPAKPANEAEPEPAPAIPKYEATPRSNPFASEYVPESRPAPVIPEYRAEPQPAPAAFEYEEEPEPAPAVPEYKAEPRPASVIPEFKAEPRPAPAIPEYKAEPQPAPAVPEHKAEPQPSAPFTGFEARPRHAPEFSQYTARPQSSAFFPGNDAKPARAPEFSQYNVRPQPSPLFSEPETKPQRAPAFSESAFLLGKTAAVDIVDDSGVVIVASGTVITQKEIEAARSAGALYDLVTGVK